MALAIRMEKLLGEKKASDYAALASLGSVSRPRISQIMCLTNLAPDIQETLLFLPETIAGPNLLRNAGSEALLKPSIGAGRKNYFVS
jgi:hypothetical protein